VSSALSIRLDDTTDWGCQSSDADRAAYEQAVTDAISKVYPGAEVTVQCLQIARPRACVTTRGRDGRILSDVATSERETEIEEHVIEISREVWDAGEFWTQG
jgi:hypothetical protein